MSFELYNSVFITQNSKIVRPTQIMLFGLVFELSFLNSKLKKVELEWWELKTNIRSFQILKTEISGIFVNIWWLWVLRSDTRHHKCSQTFFSSSFFLSTVLIFLLSLSFVLFSPILAYFEELDKGTIDN